MTFEEMQPYFTAASVCLSVATLGFILNFVRLIRANAKDRIDVILERLQNMEDQLNRQREWSEMEKAALRERLDAATHQVESILAGEGIDSITLIAGKRLNETADEVRSTMSSLVSEIQDKLGKLTSIDSSTDSSEVKVAANRTIAMASMASEKYSDAAQQYDAVATSGEATWEDNYSRGVAYANLRGDDVSNIAALRAYNEAITIAPNDININKKARLFTYRGAMLKRMKRFREAESDLRIALELANDEHEIMDIHYNFAGVYAMQNEVEKSMLHLRKLKSDASYMASVLDHSHDYFSNVKEHPEFRSLVRHT